jgi:NAD(P)-dependent dehydrogenase (short-subunit alcohol dehydrogenase family)
VGRLSDKIAIITGGASGIGAGTAELFVSEGARVVIADLQDDKGERLAAKLGANACYRRTDVGDEKDIEAVVAHAVKTFGRLDCMFNNAGAVGVSGPIVEITADGFDATVRVLFRGVFLGIKHAARVMTAQKSGSIISTASVAGLGSGFGPHVYSAAKAAVINLTRSVASELGEMNVRVNCICPGGIATPIFGQGFGLPSQLADQVVEPVKQVLAQMQPIPRSGVPQDIAEAALWLASDASTFVNGHALVVDGGLTTGRRWSSMRAGAEQLRATLGLSEASS